MMTPTIESFRRDPIFAAEYLNAVLEDGDQTELLNALRYMAGAFGGVAGLADQAALNATTLYRTLSPQGNPELRSLPPLPLPLLLAYQQGLTGGSGTDGRDAQALSAKPLFRRWVASGSFEYCKGLDAQLFVASVRPLAGRSTGWFL
ncbi:helix-turn-helix domain-containing transcriptional regulator [Candidatus Accumulibacter phosphatis]|jgi:DNA-binding phage protein|uniref:helix-turn-helix domain-containing transcriptional regulator n=1 Tax=Candidatus Accumulibacter phosphatis TaxID=327160 RepID=UPI000A2EFF62